MKETIFSFPLPQTSNLEIPFCIAPLKEALTKKISFWVLYMLIRFEIV